MRLRLLLSLDTEVSDQQAHEELGTVDPGEVAAQLEDEALRVLNRPNSRPFGLPLINVKASVLPLLDDEDVAPHVPSIAKASMAVIDGQTWRKGPDDLWYQLQ